MQNVLDELGPQEHVELVRAQAEALSEAELAGFLARAAWHAVPESWAETPARERAEWLLRNVARWRALSRACRGGLMSEPGASSN